MFYDGLQKYDSRQQIIASLLPHRMLWYLDITVRGASSAREQRDCKHTPVLALLACEVEGCGACGDGDGRRESTSLPRKRK
jgi:hypothetical protein